jgi:hypothetical protein
MGVTRFPGATTRQVDFTSSGTWTCPSGVYSASFLVVGAGGSGGGLLNSLITQYCVSGGGGGGGVKKIDLSVTPGTSYTITIGAKGTGTTGTGANGGYTEVLNGATSLIKSFGGIGGEGLTGITRVSWTLMNNSAGMGGYAYGATTNNKTGGGGGGSVSLVDSYGEKNGEGWIYSVYGTNYPDYAGRSVGGAGIDGYGAGGGGALSASAISIYNASTGGSSFAGSGGMRTTAGTTVGGAAVANTGCGGGGSVSFLTAGSTNGGNGADGLVRVVYFA